MAKPHRQCGTMNSNPDHQHEQAGHLSLFDESLSNDVEVKPMSAGEGCKDLRKLARKMAEMDFSDG